MEANEANKNNLQKPEIGENWEGLGEVRSINDVALCEALQKIGEPVQIVRNPPTIFNTSEFGAVSPKEEAERIRKLALLLKLSPQYQLLYAVERMDRDSRTLIDDVLYKGKLTEVETMMYDPAYRNPTPQWPLLFPPLSISKELRGKLKNRVRTLTLNTNPRDVIRDALENAAGYITTRPQKKDKFSLTSLLGSTIKRTIGAFDSFTFEDREKLMSDAYNDLVRQVGRLDSSEVHLSSNDPPWFDTSFNKFALPTYDDPLLLAIEELQDRGYDIKLFKVGVLGGNPVKETLLVVSDEKTASIIQDLYYHFFRGLYTQEYLDQDLMRRDKLPDIFGLSKEEMKQLLAWSLIVGIKELEERIIFEKRVGVKLSKSMQQELEEKKAELRQLTESGVKPPDQVYFRKRISEVVDKTIRIQEELRLEKEDDSSKNST